MLLLSIFLLHSGNETEATICYNEGAENGKYESLVRFHKWHKHIPKMLTTTIHIDKEHNAMIY